MAGRQSSVNSQRSTVKRFFPTPFTHPSRSPSRNHQRRPSPQLDLALELPGSPLEAVMSGEVWNEVYDRLAELIDAHKTTLVFVNTRRLAERCHGTWPNGSARRA